jgi:hypothetical protein
MGAEWRLERGEETQKARHMAKNLCFEEIRAALANQIVVGKACLKISQGIWRADPVVLATAPIFFGLTLEGNLQLAQMYAARLYDQTPGAISIYSLIAEARKWATGLPSEERLAVLTSISESEARIDELQPILASITKRRNEAFAHLDSRTVRNPQRLNETASLTVPDLSRVFAATGRLLSEISVLTRDVASDFDLLGVDDYEMALSLISEAKCAQVENYEKEFGSPAPFERPRNCPKS